MSSAPATAVSRHDATGTRLRNLLISALFALVLLVPKLLHLRRNASSWLAFRIALGFAGAALVVLPLSLWNSWLAAIAGLAMFLAAVLLPPAETQTLTDSKARELGALVVVNGGTYQSGNGVPAEAELFVGAERIWVLDSRLQPLLVIPTAEIASATVMETRGQSTLQVRWLDEVAEFSYYGVFAEHLAGVAQSTIGSVMHSPLPVLPKSRVAHA
jgi:hypothetical protein